MQACSPFRSWLLGLLVTGQLAAQPVPQLLAEFRHEQALRRIEARLPRSSGQERAQLRLWQVECLLELDRLTQAGQVLETLPKDSPRFFLLRARLARSRQHDELARQDLERLAQGPPSRESWESALHLATLYAETGRPSECDLAFRRCLELADQLPESQLHWQRFYYQRAYQLEKAARLAEAIDCCRLGSRHCERVQAGSSVPLRSLEATLLGRLHQFAEADRVWSGLVRPDSGKVGPLLAWGYDMLYQRSDQQGTLNWLGAVEKALASRQEPYNRLHLLMLQAQIYLYRLHDYARAESSLIAAEPLAPNRPHTLPGGWRVSLRFHAYGPEPSSELEWVCRMRLQSMRRRGAKEPEIRRFIETAAPRLRPEERAPWLYELSDGAERALALSRGLQRSKLLVDQIGKGRAAPEQWRQATALLSPADRKQAQDFLIEQTADSVGDFSPPAGPLEPLARDYLEPLTLEELVTRLEARRDLNRLSPLLKARVFRLLLEGRQGEALANAYRLLHWGEADGNLNLQASALWLMSRLDAAAGRLSRACEHMEQARQLRIRAKERESELSAARAEISLLRWSGQAERAEQLAADYSLTVATSGVPPARPAAPLVVQEAGPFLASCSRLAIDYPQFPTSVAMLPSRMVELRSQLQADQVLVQIFVAPQETVVLSAAAEGFTVQRLLVSRQLLESWVVSLRRQLFSPLDAALADAARGLLLDRLNLKNRRVVLVCPGLLQDLPWDLLGADWNCWWLWAGEASQAYPAVARPQVLALGDVPGLDLPATRLEIEGLAQIFPCHSLLGVQATRSALERLAPSSDILHLATHASLDQQPDRAHLALADGAYTARQVFSTPLKAGTLVVLSACDTANSRAQDRAPTTLANAFLAAGASQVVATLAPVEDEATRRFFLSFYGQLQAGLAPAQALQKAKAERRADGDRNWAAFVLLGGCP